MPVFTYGTLMFPAVLSAVCGKKHPNEVAVLHDYARYCVAKQDYPGVVESPGAVTQGRLYFGIDAAALRWLDEFEGSLYQRQQLSVEVTENKFISAYVYVVPKKLAFRLTDEAWDPQWFASRHLQHYVRTCEQFHQRKARAHDE